MDLKNKLRHQSPIERAISRATGVDENSLVPVMVTMRCPKCKRTTQAVSYETDPDGTVVVQCLCPECCGGDFSLIEYFGADGNQILPP